GGVAENDVHGVTSILLCIHCMYSIYAIYTVVKGRRKNFSRRPVPFWQKDKTNGAPGGILKPTSFLKSGERDVFLRFYRLRQHGRRPGRRRGKNAAPRRDPALRPVGGQGPRPGGNAGSRLRRQRGRRPGEPLSVPGRQAPDDGGYARLHRPGA